ncbi:hypothetical protein E0500_028650 [Streptomyces sp. KM273126]|uniref:hypothetical protein n=1 Tax=Streptomyces sp. KM273126 TaxID=2545247 RepID=UPI0010404810|nr:hypothetical protein [Streptomyces sp. KM273126]MBA2811262.1 hypothetical protein [Streptomyces sp. KM273126]
MHDIETFRAAQPKHRPRRLHIARQFFRFAKSHKMILIDPTSGLSAKALKGFIGQTLTLDQQRRLFRRRASGPAVHPHEALLGILSLHGASGREVRHLRLIRSAAPADQPHQPTSRTVRPGQRLHPVPLDPISWTAVQRCLAHRETQRTSNPHVMVTRHQGRPIPGLQRLCQPCPGRLRPPARILRSPDHVHEGRLLDQNEIGS